MTLSEAASRGFKRYADFQGRASRSEYWLWTLFFYGVWVGVSIIDGTAASIAGHATGGVAAFNGLVSLGFLGTFAAPSLAAQIRRLHDTNRSGWWCLISLTVVGAIPLLIWLCTRGTIGENRFGDDPLGAQTTNPPIVSSWDG
jgi:uncharacterized membrane protein YhaH (DUF805 family)